jgi:flavin-dependent dehydrogenase
VASSVYDAVIVGASFAGLAAARRLGSNVLILDRKPVGSGQASSCGAPLSAIEAVGARDSILQTHHALVIHTAGAVTPIELTEPFCTFDYAVLGRLMAGEVTAEIVQANVEGLDGQRVLTNRGSFEGRVLIDASGWRAALASLLRPDFVDRRWLFCGVETEVPMHEAGLHFWIEPAGEANVLGWMFPCGDFCRVGVGSYVGEHPLGAVLDRFLAMLGVRGATRHGGFLPSALRRPTVGHLFLVGDSAGQCFPLSGEGIRPALYFADACGRIACDVVQGQQTFLEGLAAYETVVTRRRYPFQIMRKMQDALLRLPPTAQTLLVQAMGIGPIARTLQRGYFGAIPASALR